MVAEIIDGKAFAETIRQQVTDEAKIWHEETGKKPGLAVVLVGNDPASEVYVASKGKQAKAAGFHSEEHRLSADIDQATLMAKIEALNADTAIHGILVQLPLPSHLDSDVILNAIDPEKDVDGFHPVNIGRLWSNQTAPVPCTPLGCSLLLRHRLGDLSGKKAIIIGRSNIVGKPMAALLLQNNATVTIAHSRTKNLPDLCREADIVIAAVGKPNMVQADWVKPGATVLDVGINRIEDKDGQRKLVGDVDFHAVKAVAGAITPVPGGIGPMTIACLLRNTLACAKYIEKK